MEQDLKWIRQIQRKGSREAADCLIRAYYDEIYCFVYRQVGRDRGDFGGARGGSKGAILSFGREDQKEFAVYE